MFGLNEREVAYRNACDRIVYKNGPDLNTDEIAWFKKLNKCMEIPGNTVELWEDGRMVSCKVVFKGPFTPYGAIRDCGKYYIEAHYSRYIKIDKETLTIIDYDCEDW